MGSAQASENVTSHQGVTTALRAPVAIATPRTISAIFASVNESTKPGIARLVTITAGVGFALTAMANARPAAELIVPALGVVIGSYLSAAGANAANQWLERDRDGLMRRTHARPLPTGRLLPVTVLWSGLLGVIIGVLTLLLTAGPGPALIALACAAIYIFLYTPLKTRTIWNTLVGALPGAFPPMIGAAAASRATGYDTIAEPIGIALFTIMAVWQIPHFLAIAWLYRRDYARGGYRMLPVIDRSGRITSIVIVATTAALLPLVLLLPMLGVGSIPYAIVATLITAWFLWKSIAFATLPTRQRAKSLFIASIIQLPIVLVAAVAEPAIRLFLG